MYSLILAYQRNTVKKKENLSANEEFGYYAKFQVNRPLEYYYFLFFRVSLSFWLRQKSHDPKLVTFSFFGREIIIHKLVSKFPLNFPQSVENISNPDSTEKASKFLIWRGVPDQRKPPLILIVAG